MNKFDENDIVVINTIGATNITIDVQKLYDILPVITSPEKLSKDDLKTLPDGTIVNCQLISQFKGIRIKKPPKKFFRNGILINMIAGKLIHVKIPKKGKIQLTGCKSEKQAIDAVKILWELIKPHADIYTINSGSTFQCVFLLAMTRVHFNLGLNIERQKLNEVVNNSTTFKSLLNPFFGCTGLKVTKYYDIDPYVYQLNKLEYVDGWTLDTITYDNYLSTLTPTERHKELSKTYKNTFLVFWTGSVIMGGLSTQFMRKDYESFVQIIDESRNVIKLNISDADDDINRKL